MATENVNHPAHYNQSKFEAIEIIEDSLGDPGFEGFCVGNILKYVIRYRYKNGVEDLRKAAWYLDYLISHVEEAASDESVS